MIGLWRISPAHTTPPSPQLANAHCFTAAPHFHSELSTMSAYTVFNTTTATLANATTANLLIAAGAMLVSLLHTTSLPPEA